MSHDKCLDGLTRTVCKSCGKKLSEQNRSGFCRLHYRNHDRESEPNFLGGRAWTVIRPDLLKQLNGEAK